MHSAENKFHTNEHPHILTGLNRMMKSQDSIDNLLTAHDPEEMLETVKEREMELLDRL